MKISFAVASLVIASSNAFVVQQQPKTVKQQQQSSAVALEASKVNTLGAVALVGWTLATASFTAGADTNVAPPSFSDATTQVLAEGAYVPEPGYGKKDLSLPDYNIDEDKATPKSEILTGKPLSADDVDSAPAAPLDAAGRKAQKKAERAAAKQNSLQEAAQRKAARAAQKAESEADRVKASASKAIDDATPNNVLESAASTAAGIFGSSKVEDAKDSASKAADKATPNVGGFGGIGAAMNAASNAVEDKASNAADAAKSKVVEGAASKAQEAVGSIFGN